MSFGTFPKISLINKIFNINDNEWSRVGFAWIIRFLYRVGFVVGWTIIVAMFVARYGIASLPYLFVMNAFFTILGTVFYSSLLHHFRKNVLMIWTVVAAIITLSLAYLLAKFDLIYFFLLLVVAESIFLVQFKIIFDGYIEEMFTPLESERTFPLIEASETVGGIIAGLGVTLLAGSIDTFNFVVLWIMFLLLMIPLIVLYETFFEKVEVISLSLGRTTRVGVMSKLKNEFRNVKHMGFIKGLFLVVFLQWVLFNLLEFQYTKAVYQTVSNVVMEAGSGFEHAFVHDLGILYVLFSSSALLVQLFIGSRIINYLGVIGSMILHTIVTFLSLFGLILSFDFTTAILAKNNFTITSIINMNAYHSAYYAVKDKLREHTRELLEGVVRPVGAIVGTLFLITLQFLFKDDVLIFAVNLVMIIVTILFFVVTYLLQQKYTEVAVFDLSESKNRIVRLNAIDILSQKGHRNVLPIFSKILSRKDENVVVKLKILKALRELEYADAIPMIMNVLYDEKPRIRLAALNTLLSYDKLPSILSKNLKLEYDLVNLLKQLYVDEKNAELKMAILRLLSFISTIYAIDFLLEVLKKSTGSLKADVIFALGACADPSMVNILLPFLSVTNKKQRAAAAIALGKISNYNFEIDKVVDNFISFRSNNENILALMIIGDLRMRNKISYCLRMLESKNSDVRLHAAITMAKIGDDRSIPVILEFLLSHKESTVFKVKKMLENIDVRISKNIDRMLKHLVAEKINELISTDKRKIDLDKLNNKQLLDLRRLYSIIEEYDEVDVINSALKI